MNNARNKTVKKICLTKTDIYDFVNKAAIANSQFYAMVLAV